MSDNEMPTVADFVKLRDDFRALERKMLKLLENLAAVGFHNLLDGVKTDE